MVKIYTDKTKLPETLIDNIIERNDDFFNAWSIIKSLDKEDMDIIGLIDNATVIDEKSSSIQTKFGVTNYRSLSSGCKTVLNLLYIIKNNLTVAVDVTECGQNALEVIFEIIDKFEKAIPIILRHNSIIGCTRRNFTVNDEDIIDNILDLAHKLAIEQG